MLNYHPEAGLLSNKVIMITGAGDGIGRAAAQSFAAHGATVILSGRTVSKLEAVYDSIERLNPGRAVIQPLDLLAAGEPDYTAIAESVSEQFPCLDGLLHNAAMLGARTPLQFYPWQDWQQVIQINVNGPFLLTRALMPALIQAPAGRILFTASSVGRVGRAYWGAYAVSKFAVEGMMQGLAEELGTISRVRVNSINPGATRTDMRKQAYPAENPESVATPESLMPVYLFLMGPDSSAIHGQAVDARTFEFPVE
ncbi:MAG: YciK family oxidoreductase [Pseudohongiellaceae bacterium]